MEGSKRLVGHPGIRKTSGPGHGKMVEDPTALKSKAHTQTAQKRVEILQGAIGRCLKILDRTFRNLDTSPSRYEAAQMHKTLSSALKRCNRKVPR